MIITNSVDIRTARDLVSKDKMIWCGEVGGVEATHQSQMPLYSQLEGTGSSVGTAEVSAEARCSSSSLSSSSFSTSSSSSSSSNDSHNCLLHRQDSQQDPPQGPPYPPSDRSQQCSPVIGL
ncbi:hypothetical protein Tco_0678961 [Tanacetum coccineum]|uniref:Uncharacterized protein n=1 Tax=Tanacetum coccineum TaxID=301880 RepID=A0ABQ4XGN4_9ASTR